MNPKKAKFLLKETALITKSDEDLVESITDFYWSEVRKSLVEIRGHNIFVEGLGTFRAKSWKVPELISKYEIYLSRYKELAEKNQLTLQKFAIRKDIELRLSRVENLKEMILADKLKKENVKKRRYENS